MAYKNISKYAKYLALIGIMKYSKKYASGNDKAKAIMIEKNEYVGYIITFCFSKKYIRKAANI